jgi:hypothetical protein
MELHTRTTYFVGNLVGGRLRILTDCSRLGFGKQFKGLRAL